MLGYRDSGMPDSPANEHPDSFHQADLDEAAGRLVEVDPPHPAAGRHHLRRRPARLPAPRPPEGPRHLGAGVRPGRRPGLVPGARRAVPAVEAVLLDVVAGPDARRSTRRCSRRDGKSPFDEKWFERPDTDHRITTRVEVGDFQWARSQALRAHATQVDPNEAFWFGLDDAELARSTRGRTGSSPARWSARSPRDDERDLFAGVRRRWQRECVTTRPVPRHRRQEGRVVDGPDDADVVVTVPLSRSSPTASTPPSPTCRASSSRRAPPARCSSCCARRGGDRPQPARITSLSSA